MASKDAKSHERVSVLFFSSAKFGRILRGMRTQYQSASAPTWLVVPYVLTCAAALEARLNDALFEYATNPWRTASKAFAEALLSMSFRGKLNSIVPLRTANEFMFEPTHFVYRRLTTLISVRNLLVHAKPIAKDFPLSGKRHPVLGFNIPEGISEASDDMTLGATDQFSPPEYHEALEKLDKWFFHRLPDGIAKVAMLRRNADA